MDNHELFSAIGGVEDAYLLELDHSQGNGRPKSLGLIAALITLLLTACTGSVILRHFDALQAGGIVDNEHTVTWDEMWENPDDYSVNGDYLILYPNTVALEVTVEKGAPEKLEQPCLPLTLLEYGTVVSGSVTETTLSLEFSAKVPRYGFVRNVLYQQHVLPEDGRIKIENFVEAGIMKEKMKYYGDVCALEIEGNVSYPYIDTSREKPIFTGHIYTKHIFWSDGYYLYCLKIPITYNLPVTAVEKIVTSLTAVDDFADYIPAG